MNSITNIIALKESLQQQQQQQQHQSNHTTIEMTTTHQ